MRAICPVKLRPLLTRALGPVPLGHVRVKVEFAALNRADVLQVRGKYPPPPNVTPVPGLELSGFTADGRRVAALVAGGAFAEFVDVPEGQCVELPPAVSLQEGAGLLECGVTAVELLRLSEIDDSKKTASPKVLLHAAAGGVGSALLQLLAPLAHVHVIAVVGDSAERADYVRRLGAAEVLDRSTQIDWAAWRKAFDVVFDCVGSAAETLPLLAADGRWILYGTLGGTRGGRPLDLLELLKKRVQLRTMILRSSEQKPRLVSNFVAKAFPLLEKKRYFVPVWGVRSWHEFPQAVADLENNRVAGKLILRVD